MTTRLDALWAIICDTADDATAIALVECDTHTGMGLDETDPDQSHDDCPTCGAPPSLSGAARQPDASCPTCGAPVHTGPVPARIGFTGTEDPDVSF